MPDLFCDFFSRKIATIRQNLDNEPCHTHPVGELFNASVFSAFSHVTDADVLNVIKKSAPKTCNLDPVPTTLLLDFIDDILPFITTIINDSLLSGVFPDVYKEAIVTPLLKKANSNINDFKNYRPISNLSFISKIIEKVVLLQLSHHLSINNLFNRDQSAYRPGHSTETALNKVMNDLLLSLDSGNISILTLLDLSAAFDTIDHNILLSRLEHVFGISGTPLSWFRSYLLERQQTVVIQTHRSNPAVNSYGVPQGSVLGPILFILYTTPLSNVISSHDVLSQSFADDTQLQKIL